MSGSGQGDYTRTKDEEDELDLLGEACIQGHNLRDTDFVDAVYDAVFQYSTEDHTDILDNLIEYGTPLYTEVRSDIPIRNPFVELVAWLVHDEDLTISNIQTLFVTYRADTGTLIEGRNRFAQSVFNAIPQLFISAIVEFSPLNAKDPGCYYHTHGAAKVCYKAKSEAKKKKLITPNRKRPSPFAIPPPKKPISTVKRPVPGRKPLPVKPTPTPELPSGIKHKGPKHIASDGPVSFTAKPIDKTEPAPTMKFKLGVNPTSSATGPGESVGPGPTEMDKTDEVQLDESSRGEKRAASEVIVAPSSPPRQRSESPLFEPE